MIRNLVAATPDVVRKDHGGPDGSHRAATAAAALRHATGHGLQVPDVIDVDGSVLRTRTVTDAVNGATLLATSPATVLHAIGSIARRLHALEPPPGFDRAHDGPAAWVHGDLCPVNLLFGADNVLRAVVDWEDSHVGDPLVDLAWTEWLVRTWHPSAVEALPVLYAAYGRTTPPTADRRTAMRRCLSRHCDRDDQTTDWAAHLGALGDLDLSLPV